MSHAFQVGLVCSGEGEFLGGSLSFSNEMFRARVCMHKPTVLAAAVAITVLLHYKAHINCAAMTDLQPITVDSDISSVEDDSQCEVNDNDFMLLRNYSWVDDKMQYNLLINHTIS